MTSKLLMNAISSWDHYHSSTTKQTHTHTDLTYYCVKNINKKLELKIFHQIYSARKPPKSPPPGSDTKVPSTAVALCLQRAHTIHTLPRGDGSTKHIFCPWWPWPLTLTFKLVWARDLPCEFSANPFSHSLDIWGTNKKLKTALKTEPYLRAVITQLNESTEASKTHDKPQE